MAKEDGPRVAVFDLDGFDTHASQGNGNGEHSDKLAEFDGNIENLVVMHARAEDLDEFLKTLESSIDQTEMRISALGPVVASHGGPGVIGISFTLKN